MTLRLSPYCLKWLGKTHLRVFMVMYIIMAVINMGCYVWINNSVAVIPDSDPTTIVKVELYDGLDNGHSNTADDIITSPHESNKAGSHSQQVVQGNGTQDDNRTESYFYRRTLSFVALTKAIKSSSNFNERYTAAAYKDFGHLKVMPAGDGVASIISSSLLASLKGLLLIAGGLLFVKTRYFQIFSTIFP